MSSKPKTGDRLFEIVLEDIAYILAKFAWMIMTVCWAHQINLVVGEFLLLKVEYRVVIALTLDVIKWFNNYNRALFYLRSEQILTYDGDF